MIRVLSAVSTIALMLAMPAKAQDKSQYSLFNPTPTDKMRPFSTDRPTKSNVPYTVDAGRFQYEGDIFIYSFDGSSTFDTNTTTIVLANPTFKVGLTNFMDFELSAFSAYNNIRSEMRSAATSTTATGFGDTFTRFKINLFGNEGGDYALAVISYAKWPTAPVGIGNRYVEGGVIALAIALPEGFNMILMGQLDYLKNPNDTMYHVNFPALVNISREVFEGVTLYAELYANWSTHRDVRDQYSLDFAIAWSPFANFQIDLGVNIGLNAYTPAHQIYAGISQRF